MIRIDQLRQTHTRVELTNEEAKKVTVEYLHDVVMGGNYINKEGILEYWTSYPHGSGTTTTHGKPTKLQECAWAFLEQLKRQPTVRSPK